MEHPVKSRLLALAVTIGTVVFGVALNPQPAQADPHAMFFTVVGQQQLFFNVLAALNQADYVETLQLRDQLAQRRDVNYVPSSAAALTETKTDLANLLTRDVTLEGQDVATAERSEDYVREVVRQRRAAALIEQLCREAFGSELCIPDLEGEGSNNIIEEREKAFIQDPLEWANIPVENGAIAALSSGTEDYQAIVDEALDKVRRGGPTLPVAYSQEIAQFRKDLESASPGVRKKFDNIVNDLITQIREPQKFDLELWKGWIETASDDTDKIQFKTNTSLGRVPTAQEELAAHGEGINEALSLLTGELELIANAGADRVALQLESTIVDGALPDRVHKVSIGVDGQPGEIATIVSAPANVKVGLQQGLLSDLLALEGNPQFVDPNQINQEVLEGESAVDREGKAPLRIGTPLEPFAQADINRKGLLQQAGVSEPNGLGGRNLLQDFIEIIILDI